MGPDPGSFNTDVNWDPVGVPDPLDTAKFSDSGTHTVTFSQSVTNNELLIDHGLWLFELALSEYILDGAIVGDDSGDVAVLTLVNGTISLPSGLSRVRIGKDAGSDGTLTVSTNATFNNSDSLLIGDAGSGKVEVVNGGSASTASTAATFIADDPGSTGVLIVSGPGSTWNNLGNLLLGNGGSGMMQVLNGGNGAVLGQVKIGDGPGSVGVLDVDGVGSSLNFEAASVIGNFGSGSVTVTNGGVFSTALITVADEVGSSGAVMVDGAGSNWIDSIEVFIGNHGSGSLTISDGATVDGVNATLGDDTDSDGTVTIDGVGSAWHNSGLVTVGNQGQGTLTVINDAVASALMFTINNFGRIEGDGLVTGDVTNSGTVSPGGLGQLNFQGNYVQNAFGRLDIQLSDLGSDKLSMTGTATLAGTLNLTYFAGLPVTTKEFTILTATNVIGTFNQVEAPPGVEVTYKPGSVVATVTTIFADGFE